MLVNVDKIKEFSPTDKYFNNIECVTRLATKVSNDTVGSGEDTPVASNKARKSWN